ncbi:MAG TPA: peptide ABC transporter substrate-binding protein [Candidatus Tumulicola sp.]|nr:peptide ABC transporter substrate-binding protein [Candidatus Tumulicola sp.]
MRAIALALLALTAAGCTKISSETPGAGAGNSWTIHRVLRVASRQEPDNLNPLFGTQVVDVDLSMLWAGYLFLWGDGNELVPELATEVPTLANGGVSADGLTITYHLRRGVKWQDGAPFDADDVIYTWHQMLNPDNFVVSRFGYDLIAGIDKRDAHTIVVHLKKRFAPFADTFFSSSSNHPDSILPKHLLSRFPSLNRVAYNNLPIGTGPFKIVSFEKGSHVTLVANPAYWRGAPKLAKIEYRIVGSDNTILTLMRTHEIDFYYRASEAQSPSLRAIPDTRVVLTPFTQFADIGINAGHPPLDDIRVRQALAYATDRRELIDKVSHGINMPGDTDQPPFFWAYDERTVKYGYDPRRAAQLLDAAGWRLGADGLRYKDGQPLRLTMVGYSGAATVNAAQVIIQHEWRQAGIDVGIKQYSSALLYATKANGGIEQTGRFDVAYEEWANGGDPDDSILVTCGMAPPAGWNIYHFCDNQLDAAENAALAEYDRSKRKAAYATVQEIMQRKLPFFIIWYVRRQDVVNTDFKNYRPAHAVSPFWNSWEWQI